MNMLLKFNGVFPLSLEIPDSLRKMEPIIKDMRDAFEHIDDRAQGKINSRGKMDAEALTVDDQDLYTIVITTYIPPRQVGDGPWTPWYADYYHPAV